MLLAVLLGFARICVYYKLFYCENGLTYSILSLIIYCVFVHCSVWPKRCSPCNKFTHAGLCVQRSGALHRCSACCLTHPKSWMWLRLTLWESYCRALMSQTKIRLIKVLRSNRKHRWVSRQIHKMVISFDFRCRVNTCHLIFWKDGLYVCINVLFILSNISMTIVVSDIWRVLLKFNLVIFEHCSCWYLLSET